MSIRMVATELYRVKKAISELEKELEGLPPDSPGRKAVEFRLAQARADHDRLKKMLDGAKA